MVHRRHGEVAALVPGLVGEVAAVLVLAGVPRAFHRVDVVVALVRGGGEARRVEDVELSLRAEVRRVADAGTAQVVLRLAGDVARVPAVGRAGQRVVHEEREVQRLARAERVDHRGARVRQQLHVGLVDLLEPADRRTVEHEAVGEDVLTKRHRGHGEVLHRSRQVTEPDVDELHVFRRDEAEDLLGTAEHQPSRIQGTLSVLRARDWDVSPRQSITKNIFAKEENKTVLSSPPVPDAASAKETKYRFTFSKLGRSRFLSHLELSGALVRALRRSSIALAYSVGYHPHPKISFATATAVGMASRQEYIDITAGNYLSDLDSLKSEINSALPSGIEILEIRKLSDGEKAIAQMTQGFEYELYLPAAIDSARLMVMKENVKNFLAASVFNIQKLSKGKTIIKDIRSCIQNLVLDGDCETIKFTVSHIQEGSARPADIISYVLKSNADESRQIKVVKTKTILAPI